MSGKLLQNTILNVIKQSYNVNSYLLSLQRMLIDENSSLPFLTVELINIIMNSHTSKSNSSNIYFTGIGKNDTIAKKSSNMLRSLQFNSHQLSPVDAMHGDMGVLLPNDIIIALSKSGNTPELIHFLKYAKNHFSKLNIIGIQIDEHSSDFDEVCDIVIKLPKIDEIDSLNLVPTMSNIVMQLYIDMIAITAIDEIGLTLSEFTRSHPGGDIGLQTPKIV